jgi:lysophospholipase L1-like esterase
MKTKNIIIIGVVTIVVLGVVIYVLVRKSKPVSSVLFIGDSNTAANFSYADQLKQRYPKLTIKKIADNGAKTDWMFNELNKELQGNKYDVVAILGGSNDIYGAGRTDVAKRSLDAMYRLAHARGSKVLAVTPPSKNFYVNKTEQKQAMLADLVGWIKNNKNTDYVIDFNSITNNKSFFNSSDDYLHPQASAHSVLAGQTAQKLKV